ncbi:hypothetical protein [Pararhodonellum marinum]|uniref:hypothetical protein n=1 Tax=Pararhodonellum marinum TaxID=2755358 RepID=UPI0018909902|nr:hypothetical protein [Pararhodonellum marinum]
MFINPRKPGFTFAFTSMILMGLWSMHVMAQHYENLDGLINTKSLDGKHAIGEHPRGLITASEVSLIRERVKSAPFLDMYKKIQADTEKLEQKVFSSEAFLTNEVPELAAHYGYLYLMSGEESWADKAYEQMATIFNDTIIFQNPVSRGLDRATMLQQMAITYDLCYTAWSQEKRDITNRQLFKLLFSVSANMGQDANYSLVSNWMGIRWSSVLFAALVWDNPDKDKPSLTAPFIWDASKRISDHLQKIIYSNGWNAESMGYHAYNWSFIAPALIAYQHFSNKSSPHALEQLAPSAIHTMWGFSTFSMATATLPELLGMKPDLSDDNLNLRKGTFGLSLRLYPPEQIPALKWMHDYLNDEGIFSILYYPTQKKSVNPEEMGWLSYADPEQGVALFRNRFQDEEDILAAYNVSATRVKGHQGPDVNTFRIIGLGAPLIVGGGRTSLMAGQSNLFPGPVSSQDKGTSSAGEFLGFEADSNGSGHAWGRGSSTGVIDHHRYFSADYSKQSGSEAVFIVADSSMDGRVWRINTPEFNAIETDENGFTITTPDGASLRGHVLQTKRPLEIQTGKNRYGGETVRLNPGIHFRGKTYSHTHWIDVYNEGQIVVVLTLQPKGIVHPTVEMMPSGKEVSVGKQVLGIVP